ncbi:hypothetical protein FRC19_009964 [Serendipita sp. 401]|nr:hypothetical protein FRC19_009964 [Serendipita sp. 401]
MAAYLPNIIHTVKTTNGTFHEYQNIEVLEEIFLHLRASQYTLIAGAVIYLYDIFMTLDEEITLIWSRNARKGLFMKILFALNRYLPLCPLSFAVFLHNPVRISPIAAELYVSLEVSHLTSPIPIGQVSPLFPHSDYMPWTWSYDCNHGICNSSIYTVIVAVCIQAIPTIFYSPDARVCAGTPVPAVGGMYITPIFVESVVAAMTLLHAIQFNKNRNEHCSVMPVINRLYLNGFVYYVIVLLLRLGSVFVYYIASPTLILLICYFEYALTSVVTSRSILAFRRVLSDTLSAGPDDKVAVTTPQFQTRHTAASATTNNTGNRQVRRPCSCDLYRPGERQMLAIKQQQESPNEGGGGSTSSPLLPTHQINVERDSRSEMIECMPLYRRSGETFVSRPWMLSERFVTGESYYRGGRPSTSTSVLTDTDATLLAASPSLYSVGRAY